MRNLMILITKAGLCTLDFIVPLLNFGPGVDLHGWVYVDRGGDYS